MPCAFAPPPREFQQYGGRRHSDRWLSERHAFSLLRSVLALRGFVMGRDNIRADDDPADSRPLRYIAPGACVLTADDEANPDALPLYDGALGHATGEQHSIDYCVHLSRTPAMPSTPSFHPVIRTARIVKAMWGRISAEASDARSSSRKEIINDEDHHNEQHQMD